MTPANAGFDGGWFAAGITHEVLLPGKQISGARQCLRYKGYRRYQSKAQAKGRSEAQKRLRQCQSRLQDQRVFFLRLACFFTKSMSRRLRACWRSESLFFLPA